MPIFVLDLTCSIEYAIIFIVIGIIETANLYRNGTTDNMASKEMTMDWLLEKLALGIGIGVLAIGIVAIVSIIAAIPTYFLWNWLMPEIFEIKTITFWQAWGINFLAGILFKGSS